jgi:Na+/H+ antiporter NhaD/arsenite permease-like protein
MIPTLLFTIFGATLLGIARFHQHALRIALAGLAAALLVRLALTDFALASHLAHEWSILVHFERSHLPDKLTEILPTGRRGPFALLLLIAVLSAVLDNIAAALIGGSAALTLFRRRVHIGYLAAIVAAANAGGAGSVIGDTTTTMMWIEGASPWWVAKAAVGAAVAILFFGLVASAQQNALQPLVRSETAAPPVDLARLGVVGLILIGAIGANIGLDFPAAGVWLAILVGALLRRPNWRALAHALPGTAFLLSLVLTASLMPVESLPTPSAWTSLGLGFVSAFFDNIPLTKLAIEQNGYDWGLLAYAVGYGGSMLWFGSSAGVAISGVFPDAKSALAWIKSGWHVAVGYVLGFFAMLALCGWQPNALQPKAAPPTAVERGR